MNEEYSQAFNQFMKAMKDLDNTRGVNIPLDSTVELMSMFEHYLCNQERKLYQLELIKRILTNYDPRISQTKEFLQGILFAKLTEDSDDDLTNFLQSLYDINERLSNE
jgi:hypothetical protein